MACTGEAQVNNMTWEVDSPRPPAVPGQPTAQEPVPTFKGTVHAWVRFICSRADSWGEMNGELSLVSVPTDATRDQVGSAVASCIQCWDLEFGTKWEGQPAIVRGVLPGSQRCFNVIASGDSRANGGGDLIELSATAQACYRSPDVIACLEKPGTWCYLHLDCPEGPPCRDDPMTKGSWRKPRPISTS